jgi:hypothetical protein
MIRMLWIVTCMALLAGCASVQWGAPPRVDHLASLTPGVSTKADLLMALGAPRGYGTGRLSPESPPMKLWFYEYVEAKGQDISLKILVVMVGKVENEGDPENYEGHLWFYSGTKLTKEYSGESGGKP